MFVIFCPTGFIMMTPQLFINYKLKSVAHLPWRMLTYKALNTFIDDLFAFVIKMPILYRIGCFRDGMCTPTWFIILHLKPFCRFQDFYFISRLCVIYLGSLFLNIGAFCYMAGPSVKCRWNWKFRVCLLYGGWD